MYRQCTTEKTAVQQQVFQNALFHAMADLPYQDISITSLCENTGLSRNIFYRLFDCKDDVLYSLIDQCFFELSQTIDSYGSRDHLLKFYQFWKKKKILLDILEKNHLSKVFEDRALTCCMRVDFDMQKYIQANWKHLKPEILTFYVGGFISLLLYWHRSDYACTEEDMADITLQLISNPSVLVQ